MKAVMALVLVMMVCVVGSAFGEVTNVWMRQVGSGSTDYGAGVAADGLGHVYMEGSTLGSFVPGGGTFPFDPYLVKYDSTGNRLWIRQSPDGADVEHRNPRGGVCADGAGNVYVAGDTEGPLPGGNGHLGKSDAFVAKYDNAGQQLWVRQFGGGDLDSAHGVSCDTAGNVYVIGTVGTSLGGFKTNFDVFVCKYSPDGALVWWRKFSTAVYDVGMGVACDEQNNLYVTGSTTGDLFGSNSGDEDAFLIKLNAANGGTIWSRQFGTDDQDRVYGIATDAFGSVFLAGSTEGNLSSANQGFCDLFSCR